MGEETTEQFSAYIMRKLIDFCCQINLFFVREVYLPLAFLRLTIFVETKTAPVVEL